MPSDAIAWPLLPVPDARGQLGFPATLDESVRDSIRIILSTRPGELLAHPDFGAGLDLFLNDLDNMSTRRAIHDRIAEQLALYEPRLSLERIDIDADAANPAQLRVAISYRLQPGGDLQTVGLGLSPRV